MKTWKAVVGLIAVAALGIGYARWQARPLTVPELITLYKLPNSQFAEIDGVQVHYAVDGAKDLPCVVMLQGVNQNLRIYDGVVDAMKSDFHMLRIDTLTMGLTAPDPKMEYGADRNQRIVEALTQRLGLTRCSFLTNGGGGRITYRYATAHPERVERVIFINSAGAPHNYPPAPAPSLFDRAKGWISPRNAWADRLYSEFGSIPPSPEWVQMTYDMNRRAGLDKEIKIAKVAASGDDAEKYLPNLRMPTLVLWGTTSHATPVSDVKVFEKALSNSPSMTKLYEHAGHHPFLEYPKDVVRDMTAFLKGERDGELRQPVQAETPTAGATVP